MTPKAPPQLRLDQRPDGSFGLVDEAGKPVADGKRYMSTAADMAKTWAYYVQLGLDVGREAGVKAGATAGIRAGQVSGARAGVDAGIKAVAQAIAEAGVKAGAEYAIRNTRVRRRVERDAEGRIVATVETREPTKGKP